MSPPTSGHDDDASLQLGSLMRSMVLGLLAFALALGVVATVFRDDLLLTSKIFVEELGGAGVFLGWYIADGFTVPLPVDVFVALGLIGGLGALEVFLWASAGSVAGAFTGFHLGRRLQRYPFFMKWWRERGRAAEALVERYGVTALVVAALSPLPFSIVCWAAGAMGMSLERFAPITLLRLVRVGVYLLLIEQGVLAVV